MEIKVLELGASKARILFVGEGHTFMNLLTSEILKDPEVDVARYVMEFQFSDPELLITTHGGRDPVSVVTDACKRIAGDCDDLLEQLIEKA
ncbi:MAG TPA: DNA-directed RNA polymerase subunit L [Methanomicrobiales archaeon]|nr:DNA-directed RNA polymerase subunit L [Methanomicrobiales archaeon]